jgi:hypothetical protein
MTATTTTAARWFGFGGQEKTEDFLRANDPVPHSITVNLPVGNDALPFFHAARRAGQVLPPATQVRNLCVALDLFHRHNPNIHESVDPADFQALSQ